MPLLTAAQRSALAAWSFLKDHQARRADLVDVARIVYKTLEAAGGAAPTAAECEGPLKVALLGVGVFTRMLRSKHHAQPALYDPFAEGMARLLLDDDWADIIRP
jgi:hypothetical protein